MSTHTHVEHGDAPLVVVHSHWTSVIQHVHTSDPGSCTQPARPPSREVCTPGLCASRGYSADSRYVILFFHFQYDLAFFVVSRNSRSYIRFSDKIIQGVAIARLSI